MFDWVTEAVGGAWWAYPLIFGVVTVDSFFPVVPGETVVLTGGVLAAAGELSILLVLLAGMLGGVAGDNTSYGLGATLGRRAERRLFRTERQKARLRWARAQLDERGLVIILVARFIPGGRTATTFAAGTLAFRWRRFIAIDAIASTLWGMYASLLGYFGGSAFTESLWKPLLIAAGVAVVVGTVAELLRRARLTTSSPERS